jgi:hypothetical protein
MALREKRNTHFNFFRVKFNLDTRTDALFKFLSSISVAKLAESVIILKSIALFFVCAIFLLG